MIIHTSFTQMQKKQVTIPLLPPPIHGTSITAIPALIFCIYLQQQHHHHLHTPSYIYQYTPLRCIVTIYLSSTLFILCDWSSLVFSCLYLFSPWASWLKMINLSRVIDWLIGIGSKLSSPRCTSKARDDYLILLSIYEIRADYKY